MSESLNLGDLGYPTADTVRRAAAYHRILTDLIAEMRSLMDESYADLLNEVVPNHALWEAVVHAEARLREVTGDE